jgi:hypothetical protein
MADSGNFLQPPPRPDASARSRAKGCCIGPGAAHTRRVKDAWAALALGGWAAALYSFTGPPGGGGDAFVFLAGAFLHGQLWIGPHSWLELVPTSNPWAWYVPFPPAPALTLMPLVAIWPDISGYVMAAIVGGINVGLVYLLLRGWGCSLRTSLWLTAAFALTVHWWIAGLGGTHHYAQVVAVFFILGALNLAVRQRWPLLAGILLGLAVASRLPMIGTLPALLVPYGWRPRWNHAFVLLGILPVLELLVAYNLARFGDPLQFGYALIPSNGGPITNEPWYASGIENVSYIPRSLWWMLLAPFSLGTSGASVSVTAPWLLWAGRARGKMAAVLGLSVVAVLLPDLAHGAWGFAQFGYRFILDAVPLLLLLLGLQYRERLPRILQLAIVASIAAYAYALIATG